MTDELEDDERWEADAVMGRPAVKDALEEIAEKLASGEIHCIALRVFKSDGTWEDIALGGDDEDKARALAQLRRQHDEAH